MYDWNVGELIKYQVPNIEFFAAAHCNLDASLTASEARVAKIIARDPGAHRVAGLPRGLVPLHQKS